MGRSRDQGEIVNSRYTMDDKERDELQRILESNPEMVLLKARC